MLAARWTALAAVVAIAVGLIGCGGGRNGTKVTKVALLTPGAANDSEWTVRGRKAFEELTGKLHLRGQFAESPSAAQLTPTLEQLSHGTQLVIAHESSYAAAAARVADQTKVPALVWGDPAAAKPGRVADVEVDGGPAGYIAGLIASRASSSRRLAIVIVSEGTPWDAATWNTIAGGYIAGARSIDRHVRIDLLRVTPDEAVSATRRIIVRHNVQTILALAGSTSTALFRLVSEEIGGERLYVGVVGDKERINQENDELASVLYNFDVVFRRAIADVRAGTFGTHGYTLSLANRGLSLEPTGRTPSDTFEVALEQQRKLVKGQISVPSTPTDAAVQALYDGKLRQ